MAALFGLHPLHVESVAWISERKDVLSTLFFMLTLLAYYHYVQRPTPLRYVSVFLALALGLMSKPMLVTAPLVLLLLDYWPLNRMRVRQIEPAPTSPLSRATPRKRWTKIRNLQELPRRRRAKKTMKLRKPPRPARRTLTTSPAKRPSSRRPTNQANCRWRV